MEQIKKIPKLKPRAVESHKGDFGKIAVIAGSVGMAGAAALAGRATLRAGAGLVRVAVPKSILPTVASIEQSFTAIPLAEDSSGRISAKAINDILNIVSENDCIAFGPGVGISGSIKSIIETLITQPDLRMVMDADGLNNLSGIKNWPEKLKAKLILTPHPGEMKRLWKGLFREPLPTDRKQQALRFAQRTNTTIVLKGSGTVVTDGNKFYINKTGNAGMATAGSGDCLTGIIAALIGQKLDDFDAAVLGAYIHGSAGDIAAEKFGQVSLIATDIIDSLGSAFKRLCG